MNTNDTLQELDLDNSDSLRLSNLYEVKFGGFGNDQIRTYLTTLKVKELNEDLTTFKALTEDKSWPVSQIIQREINFKRVADIARHYILGEGRLVKYFPPIVIAILPISQNGRICQKFEFKDEVDDKKRINIYEKSKFFGNDEAKKLFLKAENKSQISGFFVLQINKSFNYNILCWDKSKYYAIVIDGQHRYEALLKSANMENQVWEFSQDVVFLDISNLFNANEEIKPVQTIRTVFVDINNTAQLVTPVRRILMDDKDLSSLFVQSIVNDENDDNKRMGKFIQPQLIDWHGESYKHTLPHITSILVLYQIFADFILKRTNLSSISDLSDYKKVKQWTNILNERLLVDTKIEKYVKYEDFKKLSESLEQFVKDSEEYAEEENANETTIFLFDYRVLKIAQETFEQKLCRSIVKCYTDLAPYRNVISILEKEDAFNRETTFFKSLISTSNEIKENENLKNAIQLLKDKLKSLNEINYLFYTVLGQKAVFELYFKKLDSIFDNNVTEEDIFKLTQEFIEKMNEMIELTNSTQTSLFAEKDTITLPNKYLGTLDTLGTVATSFWESIIYQEKRIIYNTQGVRSLRSVIEYILDFIYAKNNELEFDNEFEPLYVFDRIKRSMKRNFEDYSDEQIEEFSGQILKAKGKFLNDYLSEAIKRCRIK